MKRLHVHIAVDNLSDSVQFYSTLFGKDPTVREVDYAKWMLEDPRVNFAISDRGGAPGLDHFGLQMETDAELRDVASRLAAAGRAVLEEQNAACCYARGEKAWVLDPQGIRWESFHTVGSLTTWGEAPTAAPATGCGTSGAEESGASCGAVAAPASAACCASSKR
jgi:catechol 2,3-dioxygenase-like lactoylglutathione lyase family enzyme